MTIATETVQHLLLRTDRRKLAARLSLAPRTEWEEAPSVEDVVAYLLEQGIAEPDAAAVKTWVESEDPHKPVLVAQGVAPVNGEDGVLHLTSEDEEIERKHERTAAVKVDYREWDTIQTVQPGEVIARITPPTEGSAGRDVFGEPIEPKAGRAAKVTVGKNAKLEETAEGGVITSTMEGLVQYNGTQLNVERLFVIKGDLDMHVGNVHFNGDVIVLGEVQEDFVVEATGNIEVKGNVTKSTLIAGGDITVEGTFYGKEGVSARATGAVRAHGAENAHIDAGVLVQIAGDVLQSNIAADEVRVGCDTGGHLRGGTIEAVGGITVGNIGSPGMSIQTHLELKWDRGLIKQMANFKLEHDRLENDRMTTERQLLHLRRMRERGAHFTVAHEKRLHELEEASHVARERETELQFLRQDLMERVQMARQSAIVVVGDVHPDAVFVIHGKTLTIDEPHGPMRIESRRDGPCMLPLVEADSG